MVKLDKEVHQCPVDIQLLSVLVPVLSQAAGAHLIVSNIPQGWHSHPHLEDETQNSRCDWNSGSNARAISSSSLVPSGGQLCSREPTGYRKEFRSERIEKSEPRAYPALVGIARFTFRNFSLLYKTREEH